MAVTVRGVELVSLWWVGAIIYVVGSILVNLGSNLIRKDHSMKLLHNPPKPIYKRPFLFAGWGFFIGGNMLNFCAFMFAAQSMLAALGSVQFVTNLAFARVVNKEAITRRAIVATVIIVSGNVLIVIFGSKTTENHTIDELEGLLFNHLFLGYLVCITVIVIIAQGLYWYFQKKIRELPPDQKIPQFIERYQPFAYALVSALVGTNSIILAKVVAGLIHNLTQGVPVFTSVWTYCIFALFIGTVSFWLYRLNNALRLYDAMFIIPILQCVWLLFGVIGGGIFFQEFASFSTMQAVFFTTGVVTLVFGILVLKPSNKAVIHEVSPSDVAIELSEMTPNETLQQSSQDEETPTAPHEPQSETHESYTVPDPSEPDRDHSESASETETETETEIVISLPEDKEVEVRVNEHFENDFPTEEILTENGDVPV
jgi:magnesium transporter